MKTWRSPLLLHATSTAIVTLHSHASSASPISHMLLLHATPTAAISSAAISSAAIASAAIASTAIASAALRAASVALVGPSQDPVPHYLPDASIAGAHVCILSVAGLRVEEVMTYSFVQGAIIAAQVVIDAADELSKELSLRLQLHKLGWFLPLHRVLLCICLCLRELNWFI